MTELPIPFSGPMVRAVLKEVDPKTQTRRLVNVAYRYDKHAPRGQKQIMLSGRGVIGEFDDGLWVVDGEGDRSRATEYCPYGEPGGHLYVREMFCTVYDGPEAYQIIYAADGQRRNFSTAMNTTDDQLDWLERSMNVHGEGGRPSIHMPKWASRIKLLVTDVRAERLQAISEADALAEGILPAGKGTPEDFTAVKAFSLLWDSINAKRAPWASNPWVWAISFRRIDQ